MEEKNNGFSPTGQIHQSNQQEVHVRTTVSKSWSDVMGHLALELNMSKQDLLRASIAMFARHHGKELLP